MAKSKDRMKKEKKKPKKSQDKKEKHYATDEGEKRK